MGVTYYGEGALYGDPLVFYGRVSSELAGAQNSQFRETGLQVSVIDERTNRWEYFTGTEQASRPYAHAPYNSPGSQTYWSYRGQTDTCTLGNGDFVRVRCDVDDQQIYIQTITDPTNASQWTTWSLLYSGVHFGVAIAPTGASSYIVYTIKTAGLYRNNSLVWSQTNLIFIDVHRAVDGRQDPDRLWIARTMLGAINSKTGFRVRNIDIYYTSDVTSVTPTLAPWNYAWQRNRASSITMPDSTVARITTYPIYAPHDAINTGDSITVEKIPTIATLGTQLNGGELVRGLPGDYGAHAISGSYVTLLSDGYYYLMYREVHRNDDWEFASNYPHPVIWQRSRDCRKWTEPVVFAAELQFESGVSPHLVERDAWVYCAGNGSVYRRPATPLEYDISDYVPAASWENPRDNQTGTGTVNVANPAGVNDDLLDLADRRLILKPGIKTADGTYEFTSLDDFWISRATRTTDGSINRIELAIGNVWSRLENQLRDTLNFVGRTEWHDFYSDSALNGGNNPNTPNEPFNYFFDGNDTEPTVTATSKQLVVDAGLVLWTAWKGHNPFFTVSFTGTSIVAYFRYVDADNNVRFIYDGDSYTLRETSAGVETILASGAMSGMNRIGIECRWRTIKIYKNGTLFTTFTYSTFPEHAKPGYVGWYRAGENRYYHFDFVDLEYSYSSEDLIRYALALGDYHTPVVGGAVEKQYAVIWGPQTDIPTAADGLRLLLDTEKLDLVWRDGVIQVGQWKSTDPIRSLEDYAITTDYVHDGNRRLNLTNVDGNEHTWFEVDGPDAILRDRMINGYFDLPELLTEDSVRNRAQEEIRLSKRNMTPGGQVPLFFDLWRGDPITWVDNAGNENLVRIEGISVEINQSQTPHQRETLDTSLIDSG